MGCPAHSPGTRKPPAERRVRRAANEDDLSRALDGPFDVACDRFQPCAFDLLFMSWCHAVDDDRTVPAVYSPGPCLDPFELRVHCLDVDERVLRSASLSQPFTAGYLFPHNATF